MYQKEDGEKVWAAFKEMDTYLEKSFQILIKADEDNYYYNSKNLKMYDGVSTLLNTNIGHRNQEMIDAIANQINQLDNATLFSATSDVSISCSKKLCDMTNHHFFSTFFTNSGSEACDTALKIAMKYNFNRRKKNCGVVALQGAYHGSNMTAMRLCQGQYENEQYFNNCSGFYQLDIPQCDEKNEGKTTEQRIEECLEQYQKLIQQNEVGVIFMELVQLSNSVYELPVKFVQEIVDISHKNGVLVIIDEVATGFGRTGKMFASEHYGIWGDIMMFAKGITSGYIPMGGVLVTRDVYECFTGKTSYSLDNGFTTGGHPVACAAALKNIEIIEKQDMIKNAEKMGKYLLEGLKKQLAIVL